MKDDICGLSHPLTTAYLLITKTCILKKTNKNFTSYVSKFLGKKLVSCGDQGKPWQNIGIQVQLQGLPQKHCSSLSILIIICTMLSSTAANRDMQATAKAVSLLPLLRFYSLLMSHWR